MKAVDGPLVFEGDGRGAVALPRQPVLDDLVDVTLVGSDGVDHGIVVKETLAEPCAGEGEATPAVLAGEGEVLDVQVPHVWCGAGDRVGGKLERGDAVARVEADAKRRRPDLLD